jgi:hypothetical protein
MADRGDFTAAVAAAPAASFATAGAALLLCTSAYSNAD